MADKKNKTEKVEEPIEIEATIEEKSTPDVQDVADDNTFAKDYLVKLDSSKNLPQEVIDRQIADVKNSALQRGLRPTGEAKLESKDEEDAYNVRLTYSVPVERNTF